MSVNIQFFAFFCDAKCFAVACISYFFFFSRANVGWLTKVISAFFFLLLVSGLVTNISLTNMMMMMMMMMMNCVCGMDSRCKALSLISSRDHFQRFSPSQIFDTPRPR